MALTLQIVRRMRTRARMGIGLVAASMIVAACSSRVGGSHGDDDFEGPDAAMIDPDATMLDGATSCAEQPCSITDHCGCGTGMSCDVDVSDNAGVACRAVTTPGHESAACDSLDDCDAGYVCVSDSYGGGACHKYCGADSECGTPRGKCVVTPKVNNVTITGVPNACSSSCDPVSATVAECPANNKCTIYKNNGNAFFDCIPAGTGTQGDSCQAGTKGDDSMCAPSFACTTVDGGGSYRCRKYCTNPGVGSSNQCGGRACNAFSPGITVAGVDYGYCSTL